ncbi:hypothetical protein VTK26DRAFT_8186 [Humicola hyalothermophila]
MGSRLHASTTTAHSITTGFVEVTSYGPLPGCTTVQEYTTGTLINGGRAYTAPSGRYDSAADPPTRPPTEAQTRGGSVPRKRLWIVSDSDSEQKEWLSR